MDKEINQTGFWDPIFWKRRLVLNSLIIAVVAIIGQWVLIMLIVSPGDGYIPLHYNVYFGTDYLGNWWEAYLLPVLGVLLLALNYYLARLFYFRERMLSLLFVSGVVVVELALLGAAYTVFTLNS